MQLVSFFFFMTCIFSKHPIESVLVKTIKQNILVKQISVYNKMLLETFTLYDLFVNLLAVCNARHINGNLHQSLVYKIAVSAMSFLLLALVF